MTIDVEERIRAQLGAAPSPPGLRLDASATTRAAARAHRRRRASQVIVAGVAALALPVTTAWALGDLPGSTGRVLPASPWACPVSGWHSDPVVDTDELGGVTIPLSTGEDVIAGLAAGCPFDALVMAISTDRTGDDLTEVRTRLLIEREPETEHQGAGYADLPLADGPAIGMLLPRGSREVRLIGPGEIRTPAADPVPVPGTGLDAAVIEGASLSDQPLALLRRGADGLLHTEWHSPQAQTQASRAWSGGDPDLAETWVAQDDDGQQWVMHQGEVRGPFAPMDGPRGFIFEGDDPSSIDVVVLTPGVGDLMVEDATVDPLVQLSTDRTTGTELSAVTTRLHFDEPSRLEMIWQPEDGEAQPVALED